MIFHLVWICKKIQSHLKENGLDFCTVFSNLLLHIREKEVFGGHSSISNALSIAHHPYVNIWNTVLRLQKKAVSQVVLVFTFRQPNNMGQWLKKLFVVVCQYYLIWQESQFLEEVLCQFDFILDCFLFHLWSHRFCLLAHSFLKTYLAV